MRFPTLLAGTAVLLALAGSALVSPARADDVVDTCAKGHGDAKIDACTKAIKSGRWRGRDIAWAYVNRGWAYEDRKDHDRAIADETEAIRLDPKNAFAYVNRGWVYDEEEDYDRAIADETEAIRLDPNNASAYIYRGWAHDDKDQYDLAIADESEAIRIDPNKPAPTTIAAAPTSTSRIMRAPSPTSARRSNSRPNTRRPIATAPASISSPASSPTRSPTSPRPTRSTPRARMARCGSTSSRNATMSPAG